jgi:hypothetical protein
MCAVQDTHDHDKAVVTGLQIEDARVEDIAELSRFRRRFYECLPVRADALFELTDAVLCTDGPVTSLVQLSLSPVFRRGHGALYDALACGEVDTEHLRDLLIAHLPADAPLMFAIDGSTYPRPDAECSPEREPAYAPCRCDGERQTIPGWEFQWAVGLEWGTSSWTVPVDAIRPGPRSETAHATADQIHALVARLEQAGRTGGPDRPVPMMVMDSGFPAAQLTYLLSEVPVQLLVRLNEDRVFFADPAPRRPGQVGRPGRHGERLEVKATVKLRRPDQLLIVADSGRYGRVEVRVWHRLHQVFGRRGIFDPERYPATAKLPIVRGTVIEVRVERLPDGRAPHRVLWLWHSGPDAPDLDVCWRAYLRRFDQEHTYRFGKSELGWTCARLRTPAQTERWTWLILAACTQLRLARHLTDDLRRPWERPPVAGKGLSPYRVRRGFPHIRGLLGTPARVPKPTRAGPGRPEGSRRGPAKRYPVGTKPALRA